MLSLYNQNIAAAFVGYGHTKRGKGNIINGNESEQRERERKRETERERRNETLEIARILVKCSVPMQMKET